MKQEPTGEDFRKPSLRGDLEFSRNGGAESHITTVKDPLTGRFYRFGPVESFILKQLDGTAEPDDIQDKAAEKFGALLDSETLGAFVRSLHQRGLLKTTGAAETGAIARAPARAPAHSPAHSPARAPEQGRIRGSLLYLRFKLFDPDQRLDRMVGHLHICFTRPFVIASAAVILLSILTFLANSDEIGRDFQRIFRPGSIIPALLIVLATTIGHEFAHGLTCKHYGGRVQEMGFLLLFFQPALYCNVSDAWMFAEKSKRMWVGLAGTYFELLLWALAVFAWRITAPETLFNFTALVLIGTSGIRIFLNLNPLIKLDGYYVLGDWLEIPNLRTRAFSFIRAWARRPWALSRINIPAREKRIYLLYGLAGMAFTIWILGYIATAIAGFLTGQLQGIGFIIFVSLLLLIFIKPIAKLKARIMGQTASHREKSS